MAVEFKYTTGQKVMETDPVCLMSKSVFFTHIYSRFCQGYTKKLVRSETIRSQAGSQMCI